VRVGKELRTGNHKRGNQKRKLFLNLEEKSGGRENTKVVRIKDRPKGENGKRKNVEKKGYAANIARRPVPAVPSGKAEKYGRGNEEPKEMKSLRGSGEGGTGGLKRKVA